MRFSRQEYWSRLPFLSPGDLPNPGIEPSLLHWQVGSLPLSYQGSPSLCPRPQFRQQHHILFSGPWDWIVTVVNRESTLYFWISPLEWSLFKKTSPSPWNKEEKLKGNEMRRGWQESPRKGLSTASPTNTPAWDQSLANKLVSPQRVRRIKVQKTQHAEDIQLPQFPSFARMFLGSLSWPREELRIFPALPSLSGTCTGKGASESGQKVTCMDVAPATRWASVDAGTEACEWPGPEGTQLCKQMQHQQNAVLLAQLSSVLTQ